MDFSLTDEQRLLRETVDRFVAEKCSFEQQREMASTPQGFSRDIWGQTWSSVLRVEMAHACHHKSTIVEREWCPHSQVNQTFDANRIAVD